MGARGRATVSAGMLTLIGEAVAVGDNTLITGSIAATSRDLGPVTKASGTTTFTSAAQATDGGIPYASAQTYADAAGADLLITRSGSSSTTETIGDRTTMAVTSTTFVFALDLEEEVDLPRAITVSTNPVGTTHFEPGAIDGNVAFFDAYAERPNSLDFVVELVASTPAAEHLPELPDLPELPERGGGGRPTDLPAVQLPEQAFEVISGLDNPHIPVWLLEG
jgi:hypothetical protein